MVKSCWPPICLLDRTLYHLKVLNVCNHSEVRGKNTGGAFEGSTEVVKCVPDPIFVKGCISTLTIRLPSATKGGVWLMQLSHGPGRVCFHRKLVRSLKLKEQVVCSSASSSTAKETCENMWRTLLTACWGRGMLNSNMADSDDCIKGRCPFFHMVLTCNFQLAKTELPQ